MRSTILGLAAVLGAMILVGLVTNHAASAWLNALPI